MSEPRDRLRRARIRARYPSGAAAAQALGIKTSTYNAHENGQNKIQPEHAEVYGRKFDVEPSWILFGDPELDPDRPRPMGAKEATANFLRILGKTQSPSHEAEVQVEIADIAHAFHPEVDEWEAKSIVPVVGYVGAGSEIFPEPSDAGGEMLEEVEIDFPTKRGTAAAIVRGDSMLPVFEDGDLIGYYRDGYDVEQMLGRQCVVKLSDGRIFLKTLKASRFRGLYTLSSFNSRDIEDVEVEWAAPFRFRISRFNWRKP